MGIEGGILLSVTLLQLLIFIPDMEQLTFEQLPLAISQLGKRLENIEKILLNQSDKQAAEPSDQLLTVHQAADFLNLSVSTVYGLVSRRELPVMKRSKRLYFSRTELLEYLKTGHKKSKAELEAEAEAFLKSKRGGTK